MSTTQQHHPWCNYFMRTGPCKMCDGLNRDHPVLPGDTYGSLMERHFPQNVLRYGTGPDAETPIPLNPPALGGEK